MMHIFYLETSFRIKLILLVYSADVCYFAVIITFHYLPLTKLKLLKIKFEAALDSGFFSSYIFRVKVEQEIAFAKVEFVLCS